MTIEDIVAVYSIEKTSHRFPWTKQLFQDCLKVNYHCYVIEVKSTVAGFVIFDIDKTKCHVLNICVDHTLQAKGLGSALLKFVISQSKKKCKSLFLEIRASNIKAHQFYRKHKFKQIKTIKNYYADSLSTKEDGFVLERKL